MLVDIHTHQCSKFPSILNIHARNFLAGDNMNCSMFSVGLHPWYSQPSIARELVNLLSVKRPKLLVALGECGVDHIKGPSVKVQVEVFEMQTKLAAELSIPVIVHQVKSIGDIFPVIKAYPQVSFILHDYRGNMQQTAQLLKYNVYFSFGEAIFSPTPKLKNTLCNVPVERVFFETDDSHTRIDNIYKEFTVYQFYSLDELNQIIHKNFNQVFKIKL